MADTPIEFYGDPRKKPLDHLNAECFALEQLAKQYGHPDIQHALYRVRANEISIAETFLRGQIRREVEASESSAAPGVPGTPAAAYEKPYGTENRMQLPPGYEVWATDVQPNTERGSWKCSACGFQGFWRGGPHCGPAGVPPTVRASDDTARLDWLENAYTQGGRYPKPWREFMTRVAEVGFRSAIDGVNASCPSCDGGGTLMHGGDCPTCNATKAASGVSVPDASASDGANAKKGSA